MVLRPINIKSMLKAIKRFKIIFSIIIVVVFFAMVLSIGKIYSKKEIEYGVTFSKKQAISLGLDWKETFVQMLDDLGVKKLRLAAYWDEIESSNDIFEYQDLDWQIEEAGKRNVEIILAVGGRLPRWPECHFPFWIENLSKEQREKETLFYIEKTILKYKDNKNIYAWQIENEPFLSQFGICPELDPKFLDQEISLVKRIDTRPIIVTDSGELSVWIPAAKRADIFGTTMYRDTYSEHLKAYVHYPIEPGFFRFKKNIAKLFARPSDWVVIELQGEPWGPKPFQDLSQEERDKTMDLQKFKEMIQFSSQTGFREFYFWGVEWWYWEKTVKNNPAIWEEAKKLYHKYE